MKVIKMNKKILCYAILLNLLFMSSICLSQFKQDEFIIASWISPRMRGNPDPDGVDIKGDLERLREFIDANFNLLSGTSAGYYSDDIDDNPDGRVGNRYILEMIDKINKEEGETVLRMLALDFDYYVWEYQSPYGIINNYMKDSLADSLRNSLYGYLIKDEPKVDELKNNQYPMYKEIQNKDPDKLNYLNAHGVSYNGKHVDRREWKKHMENISSRQPAVSWGSYLWGRVVNKPGEAAQRVFDCCKVMSKIAHKYKINWWKCVGSVEQYYVYSNGGFERGIINLTKADLSFAAFLPVIYGAKGLVWFTYESPCSPRQSDPGWCIPVGEAGHGYSHALIKADINDISGIIHNPTYNSVKDINFELKQMGPVLMNLEWLTTVHSDSANPFPNAWRLDVVDTNTPVISYIQPGSGDSTVGVGIFQKNNEQYVDLSGFDYFLLTINKDKSTNTNLTELGLKNSYWPFIFKTKEKVWKSLGSGSDFIEIELPGECGAELIGLWGGIVLTGNLSGTFTFDESILIADAYLDPGETGDYTVKGSIRILPETHIKRGSTLRLKVIPRS